MRFRKAAVAINLISQLSEIETLHTRFVDAFAASCVPPLRKST